ncbi:MAG: ABC transporter ATP-binding protein [Candidatus Lambdaproteobacteria bacterium]|nr:ABC transporter ATP-binding protein [Candidatus Lambdaproteobacteria bacterium]
MLELNNVEAIYSEVILVLKGISLHVPEGGCVALLGSNGAGKSTTLKCISGLIRPEDGAVTGGNITFLGKRIDALPAEAVVRRGLVHVMEGRKVLEHMTTQQNLMVGGHMHRDAARRRQNLERVYALMPPLANLRQRTAGYLSGGEQQMLVIGRALMAEPTMMLIDEPSLGLAPMLVEEIYAILAELRAHGLTLLLVEQNTRAALEIADHGYVMENGRIVMEGSAAQLKSNEDIREFYLGLDQSGERKSYRDIKHYKRRKRWLG